MILAGMYSSERLMDAMVADDGDPGTSTRGMARAPTTTRVMARCGAGCWTTAGQHITAVLGQELSPGWARDWNRARGGRSTGSP